MEADRSDPNCISRQPRFNAFWPSSTSSFSYPRIHEASMTASFLGLLY